MYRPPYYEHVESAPSLESMRSVVVSRKLRPSLKVFILNEVSLCSCGYCMMFLMVFFVLESEFFIEYFIGVLEFCTAGAPQCTEH